MQYAAIRIESVSTTYTASGRLNPVFSIRLLG